MKKRFTDWDDKVDCNDCQHYHVNKCDGITVRGSEKHCKSFLATRKVFYLRELKRLQIAVGLLSAVVIGLVIYVSICL